MKINNQDNFDNENNNQNFSDSNSVQNGHNQQTNNNFNGQGNNQQNSNNMQPKLNAWKEILIGVGLSSLIFIAMFTTLYIGKPAIISIIEFIIISYSTFLSVRFTRKKRLIVGILILATVIPMTLLLLLIGSCAAMIGGL